MHPRILFSKLQKSIKIYAPTDSLRIYKKKYQNIYSPTDSRRIYKKKYQNIYSPTDSRRNTKKSIKIQRAILPPILFEFTKGIKIYAPTDSLRNDKRCQNIIPPPILIYKRYQNIFRR